MQIFKKIFEFYYQGFKHLSLTGRQLWLIIIIKLFVIFVIFKLLFFPNFLNSNFKTDQEKSDYIIEQFTE